jgi:hypothetical protein
VRRLRRQVWSGRPPSRQAQILPQGVQGQFPCQAPAGQGSDEGLARLTWADLSKPPFPTVLRDGRKHGNADSRKPSGVTPPKDSLAVSISRRIRKQSIKSGPCRQGRLSSLILMMSRRECSLITKRIGLMSVLGGQATAQNCVRVCVPCSLINRHWPLATLPGRAGGGSDRRQPGFQSFAATRTCATKLCQECIP